MIRVDRVRDLASLGFPLYADEIVRSLVVRVGLWCFGKFWQTERKENFLHVRFFTVRSNLSCRISGRIEFGFGHCSSESFM